MQTGLLDILLGQFLDGHRVGDGDPAQNRLSSIIDNLTRLFNTRRGTIAHMPDYGLPDISQVYRDLPYSLDGLRAAIKDAIEKYEPRLRKVRVEKQPKDEEERFDMRVSFIVTGELLKGEKVQFQTTFSSDNVAEVHAWRKPT